MPKRRTLDLTPHQRQELVDCRDHHPLPYLRERVAALLFIADGLSPAQVAKCRLLRPRDPNTEMGLDKWLIIEYIQPNG